jgi:hypothetical protein
MQVFGRNLRLFSCVDIVLAALLYREVRKWREDASMPGKTILVVQNETARHEVRNNGVCA